MKLKNLIRMDLQVLRNKKVADKFDTTFRRIYVYAGMIVVVMLITILMAMNGYAAMYNKFYMQDNLQGNIRIDIQAYSKSAWWALVTTDEGTREAQIANYEEKIPEMQSNLADLRKVYDNEQLLNAVDSDLKQLATMTAQLTALFQAGTPTEDGLSNHQEIYELINGDVNNVIKQTAADLKLVSADSYELAGTAYRQMLVVSAVLVILSFIVVVTAVLFARNARHVLASSMLEPIQEISRVTKEIADGHVDIQVNYSSDDELGDMSSNLRTATEAIHEIVADLDETLARIADGDFTRGSDHPELYRKDYEPIKTSLDNITRKLSDTMQLVKESSSQVAQGATNMSQGASDLAEGATNQAAAIEELTASVSTVTEQTRNMAESAQQSTGMATKVQEEVENSARKMHLVTDAMERITDASQQIEQITNSIESIAKQTQLLALNASIEAARAGDAGRGFAVVAEEISSLANESSEAAKNTHQLISDTMDEIQNGNAVVEETTKALELVQESVNDVAMMMAESGELAMNQANSMDEIQQGIEQISGVVSNNSATAEETSAVSQELSEQSETLNELIEKFRIG
ncbi:MAG: HAMP domain-containing protein [Lachnospiraceae bacterium]|nr:HAMP domain-containing protein [Lachnospiraceae bacterium]